MIWSGRNVGENGQLMSTDKSRTWGFSRGRHPETPTCQCSEKNGEWPALQEARETRHRMAWTGCFRSRVENGPREGKAGA